MKKRNISDLSEEDVAALSDSQIYDIMMNGVEDLVTSPSPFKAGPNDFIVVLGATPEPLKSRVIKAFELYSKGIGHKILFSGGKGWQKLFKYNERENRHKSEEEKKQIRLTKDAKYKSMRAKLQEIFPEEFEPKKEPKSIYNFMERKMNRLLNSTEARLSSLLVKQFEDLVPIQQQDLFYERRSKNTKENADYSRGIIKLMKRIHRIKDYPKNIIVVSSYYHCKRAELTFKKSFESLPGINIISCPATHGLPNSLSKEDVTRNPNQMTLLRRNLKSMIEYIRKGDVADAPIPDVVFKEECER